MNVCRRVEGYFTGLQLEGLFVVRCEPERSFQHVNGFIARVIMPGGNRAGGKIPDKHHVLRSYALTPAQAWEGFVLTFRPGDRFKADYRTFYGRRSRGEVTFTFHEENREM